MCHVVYLFFNKSRFLCAFKNIKTIYISRILSLVDFVLNPTPTCMSLGCWGICFLVPAIGLGSPSSWALAVGLSGLRSVVELLHWGYPKAGAQPFQKARIFQVQSTSWLPGTRATHTSLGGHPWNDRSPNVGAKESITLSKRTEACAACAAMHLESDNVDCCLILCL